MAVPTQGIQEPQATNRELIQRLVKVFLVVCLEGRRPCFKLYKGTKGLVSRAVEARRTILPQL